jgi:hypothetical protein
MAANAVFAASNVRVYATRPSNAQHAAAPSASTGLQSGKEVGVRDSQCFDA